MVINRLNQLQLNSASSTVLNQTSEELGQLLNQTQQPYLPTKSADYAEMAALNNNNQQFQQPSYQTLPNQARSSSFHQRQSGSQHQNIPINHFNADLNLSFNLIESNIKEIRDYMRHSRKKLENTDTKSKQTNEWKKVALVLDRTLFFIYIIAIIVSVIVVFPR